jgi:hypothetical protein
MALTILPRRWQIAFGLLCLLLLTVTPAQCLVEESVSITAGIDGVAVDAEPAQWSDTLLTGAALAKPMRGEILSHAWTNSQLVEHTILRL